MEAKYWTAQYCWYLSTYDQYCWWLFSKKRFSLKRLVSCASSNWMSWEMHDHTGWIGPASVCFLYCIISNLISKALLCIMCVRLFAPRNVFSNWLDLMGLSRQSLCRESYDEHHKIVCPEKCLLTLIAFDGHILPVVVSLSVVIKVFCGFVVFLLWLHLLSIYRHCVVSWSVATKVFC